MRGPSTGRPKPPGGPHRPRTAASRRAASSLSRPGLNIREGRPEGMRMIVPPCQTDPAASEETDRLRAEDRPALPHQREPRRRSRRPGAAALPALYDIDEPAVAEPDTLCFSLYHLPVRSAAPAVGCGSMRPGPALGIGVHHLPVAAHRPPGRHPTAGHRLGKDRERAGRQHFGAVEPGAPAASRDGPPRTARGPYGRTAEQVDDRTPLTNRGQPADIFFITRLILPTSIPPLDMSLSRAASLAADLAS